TCFFFQAEDGIRAFHVTGVQTCALPISPRQLGPIMRMPARRTIDRSSFSRALPSGPVSEKPALMTTMPRTPFSTHCWTTSSTMEIGRASCRDGGGDLGGDATVSQKKRIV